MGFEHTSVMPREVQEHQHLRPGHICVDCTLGGCGHALSTVRAILPDGLLIGIDRDLDAIDHARTVLSPYKDRVRLFHDSYKALPGILNTCGIKGVHAILLDLGLSLNQLRHSRRGFSFSQDEPLDMRMDTRVPLTAYEIVNTFPEKDLVDIFFQYGEETFSRRIARKIMTARTDIPIRTSRALADIIASAVPVKIAAKQRIHPATRIFQALRIAVNKELEQLETFMEKVPDMLLKNGRICVISFHSLEDRIVKRAIRKFEKGCSCPTDLPLCRCGFVPQLQSVFKRPLLPSEKEIGQNPMARSAKLRVAQKI